MPSRFAGAFPCVFRGAHRVVQICSDDVVRGFQASETIRLFGKHKICVSPDYVYPGDGPTRDQAKAGFIKISFKQVRQSRKRAAEPHPCFGRDQFLRIHRRLNPGPSGPERALDLP